MEQLIFVEEGCILLEEEVESTRDGLLAPYMDALDRTAEVERLLAEEYATRERLVLEEAERRAAV